MVKLGCQKFGVGNYDGNVIPRPKIQIITPVTSITPLPVKSCGTQVCVESLNGCSNARTVSITHFDKKNHQQVSPAYTQTEFRLVVPGNRKLVENAK